MRVDKDTFFTKTKFFLDIPLYQSEGYFLSKQSSKVKFDFFIDDVENPSIGCFGRKVKIPVLGGYVLYIDSLCYNTFDQKRITAFLLSIINESEYKIIDISDDNIYMPTTERAYRMAGFRRPLGQFGTNLTIVVDLNQEIKYKTDWKQNIKKSSNK